MGVAPMTRTWRGRWRIVETDLWSDDAIDLLEPAHIDLAADGSGTLVVGALQADLDCRPGTRDGVLTLEFSWLGDDDGHPVSGRGWAQRQDGDALRIKLYIHQGDETVMTATPITSPARTRPPRFRSTRRQRSR